MRITPLDTVKVIVTTVAITATLALCAWLALSWYIQGAKNDVAFFEKEILAFEESDALAFPEPDRVLFVGSSSIRLWETLEQDMQPLPIIQRGFGGAHMSHVLHNFERIITTYQPKAVVIFVGGNDIGSGKSVEQLIADYESFLVKFNNELPESDLWILSMKPSKLRWKSWAKMKEVDEAFRKMSLSHNNIRFIETGATLLGKDGKPDDVYIFDGLHLNSEGYRRWAKLLKPLLLKEYLPSSQD